MSESFNPAWRTQEPPVLLHVERIILSSTLLGMITYGAHIVVFLASLYSVLTSPEKRHKWLQTAFITCLFAFGTLYSAHVWENLQFAYVEYRGFPGGPAAFYPIIDSLQASRYDFGNAAAVLITWLSDAMLIWRCWTVWSRKWVVIVLPVIMLIGSIVTGSITCYEASRPRGTLVALGAFNFNLSFWAISISLNMLLTALIIYRLLRARVYGAATLGPEYKKIFVSTATILVESAVLYAVVGFVFIVAYGVNSLDGLTIQQVLVHIEAISPELMILRIARGYGWPSNPSARLGASTGHTGGSQTLQDSAGDIAMTDVERDGDLKYV